MASGIGNTRLFNTTPSTLTLATARLSFTRRAASFRVLFASTTSTTPSVQRLSCIALVCSRSGPEWMTTYRKVSRSSFILSRNPSAMVGKRNSVADFPLGSNHRSWSGIAGRNSVWDRIQRWLRPILCNFPHQSIHAARAPGNLHPQHTLALRHETQGSSPRGRRSNHSPTRFQDQQTALPAANPELFRGKHAELT